MDWAKKLEEEYGQYETARQLIQEFRTETKMSDEEIYNFLESFY